MMTAAMKPLGISIWQLFAARPMYKAGGRLFVDVTPELSGPSRAGLLQAMGQHDPLSKDALERLLDVADAVRPYPAVIAYLQQVDGDDFLDKLAELDGGPCTGGDRGFSCVAWARSTSPRERPSGLIPLILSNVRNFEPGEAARRFEQGLLTPQLDAELIARRKAELVGSRG